MVLTSKKVWDRNCLYPLLFKSYYEIVSKKIYLEVKGQKYLYDLGYRLDVT